MLVVPSSIPRGPVKMVLRPPLSAPVAAALRRLSCSLGPPAALVVGARGASGTAGGGVGADGEPPHMVVSPKN